MKKIFLLFCLLCISVTTVMAQDTTNWTRLVRPDSKTVAVILDFPVEFINNSKMNTMVMNKVQTTFAKPDYYIVPMEKAQIAKDNYCDEHGIPKFVNQYDMNPTLTSYDLKTLGKNLQADYVYYISFTAGAVQQASGIIVSNCGQLRRQSVGYAYRKVYISKNSYSRREEHVLAFQ